jgi:molecular chaperone GrpE
MVTMKQNQSQKPAESQNKQEETEGSQVSPVSQIDPAEEWKQKYLRVLADYQNLEKRSTARVEEVRKFAAEVTLRKFLPAIDSLTLASNHIKDEGLRLALKEFSAAFESCGVKRMEVVGKVFDPYTMECIDVIDGEDEKVIEEVTPGYMFMDKVLRVAKVKVGKKK